MVASVEPADDHRAWLTVRGRGPGYRGRAAGLSVPYPSGLKRLIAADPEIDVALVHEASPSFDRAAVEQGVSYLDRRGRGRLVAPDFVYVVPPPSATSAGRRRADVDDQPIPRWPSERGRPAYVTSKPPSRVSPFAPKASRVVRALLADARRRWRLSDLAEACRLNPGNVHRVLAALVDHDLVERDDDRYVVVDPGSLLEAWAEEAFRKRPREEVRIPVRDDLPSAVRDLLRALPAEAVVSGELAAELLAPHLPAAHAIVHCVDSARWDPERLVSTRAAPPLRPRAHILVDLADEGVAQFGEEREGLPLVSAPQLYVDLYRHRGRGREAAEHVRSEVLGF